LGIAIRGRGRLPQTKDPAALRSPWVERARMLRVLLDEQQGHVGRVDFRTRNISSTRSRTSHIGRRNSRNEAFINRMFTLTRKSRG
jgi:hypothetical protein